MEDQIATTYTTNTLTYLHLLPKDEQLNELNKMLAYFKKRKHVNTIKGLTAAQNMKNH